MHRTTQTGCFFFFQTYKIPVYNNIWMWITSCKILFHYQRRVVSWFWTPFKTKYHRKKWMPEYVALTIDFLKFWSATYQNSTTSQKPHILNSIWLVVDPTSINQWQGYTVSKGSDWSGSNLYCPITKHNYLQAPDRFNSDLCHLFT